MVIIQQQKRARETPLFASILKQAGLLFEDL